MPPTVVRGIANAALVGGIMMRELVVDEVTLITAPFPLGSNVGSNQESMMVIHSPLRRSVDGILTPGVTESQRVSRPTGDFVDSRSSVRDCPPAPGIRER